MAQPQWRLPHRLLRVLALGMLLAVGATVLPSGAPKVDIIDLTELAPNIQSRASHSILGPALAVGILIMAASISICWGMFSTLRQTEVSGDAPESVTLDSVSTHRLLSRGKLVVPPAPGVALRLLRWHLCLPQNERLIVDTDGREAAQARGQLLKHGSCGGGTIHIDSRGDPWALLRRSSTERKREDRQLAHDFEVCDEDGRLVAEARQVKEQTFEVDTSGMKLQVVGIFTYSDFLTGKMSINVWYQQVLDGKPSGSWGTCAQFIVRREEEERWIDMSVKEGMDVSLVLALGLGIQDVHRFLHQQDQEQRRLVRAEQAQTSSGGEELPVMFQLEVRPCLGATQKSQALDVTARTLSGEEFGVPGLPSTVTVMEVREEVARLTKRTASTVALSVAGARKSDLIDEDLLRVVCDLDVDSS